MTKDFYKITLFKFFWNIAFFTISRTICIKLIAIFIIGYNGEICHLKWLSIFVFSFYNFNITYNITNNIH